MSKIKILLAEQSEDLDDLRVPVKFENNEPDEHDDSALEDAAFRNAVCDETRDYIISEAAYDEGMDDEGRYEIYLTNFLDLCEASATWSLETVLGGDTVPLSDKRFYAIVERVRDRLADHYADLESELCEDFRQDMKEIFDYKRSKEGR